MHVHTDCELWLCTAVGVDPGAVLLRLVWSRKADTSVNSLTPQDGMSRHPAHTAHTLATPPLSARAILVNAETPNPQTRSHGTACPMHNGQLLCRCCCRRPESLGHTPPTGWVRSPARLTPRTTGLPPSPHHQPTWLRPATAPCSAPVLHHVVTILKCFMVLVQPTN